MATRESEVRHLLVADCVSHFSSNKTLKLYPPLRPVVAHPVSPNPPDASQRLSSASSQSFQGQRATSV